MVSRRSKAWSFDMSGMGRLPDGEVTGTAHGMAAQA
jgi:hypothetical protein